MFATVFTFACFLMYIFPLLSAWHVGFDGNVMFWIGLTAFLWLLLPIPILFIVNFVMQLRNPRPKRSMILACLVVPCVSFFLIGGILKFQSGAIETKLGGRDCATWPRMRALDLSWQQANSFLEGCRAANPAFGSGLLIQTCPGYEDHMWDTGNNEFWPYLQFLEANYGCVGFCKSEGSPLWSRPAPVLRPPDACSASVSSVLRTKVKLVAMQLMSFSLMCLFVSLAWMSFFGNTVLSSFDKPKGSRPSKFVPAPLQAGSTASLYTPQA